MDFFKKFNTRKLLSNKKIAIALSILIAFVFWISVSIEQKPEREQTFNNIAIEVNTKGTALAEKNIELVGEVTQKASVTVFGPNYVVSSLRNDDIRVMADLSGITSSGTVTVSLTAIRNSAESGYVFVSVNPSTITLNFDYFDTKTFQFSDIVAKAPNITVPESSLLKLDKKVASGGAFDNVTIKGPRTLMNRLSSVEAYSSVKDEILKDETYSARLRLLDSGGQELDISMFDVSEEELLIIASPYKTKVVSLVPDFYSPYDSSLNSSVINALTSNTTLDATKVTIKGSPDVIENIDSIGLPVDISKLTAQKNNTINVEPDVEDLGVEIMDAISTVKVVVDLTAFDIKNVRIYNLEQEGSTYPDGAIVQIVGTKSLLSNLTSSDFYLVTHEVSTGNEMVNVTAKTYNKLAVWQAAECAIERDKIKS